MKEEKKSEKEKKNCKTCSQEMKTKIKTRLKNDKE